MGAFYGYLIVKGEIKGLQLKNNLNLVNYFHSPYKKI